MQRTADIFRRHGGRLAAARAVFANAPQPWLDLSTGVNPHPWRGARADAGVLRRLPSVEDLAELEAVAGRAFGAAHAAVVATAGADAALRLLPLLTGARSVAIAAPTYGGHAQVWRAAGANVTEMSAELLQTAAAEAVVIVNPNNPDGAVHKAEGLADGRRWLIVDESFVETRPEISVAGLGLPRTIVLRSFGKFYGLPGVRLGFLIADEQTAARARALVGDWPVSADAIALGRGAYADDAWAWRTRRRLEKNAARLDGLLNGAGLAVVGGTSLFRLTAAGDAADRFEMLAARGVLTRPFVHDARLLRFGLPPSGHWDRLAAALTDI